MPSVGDPAHGMAVSEKAACNRCGHQVLNIWYLWIVLECDFRVQAKNGFQNLLP